MPELSLQQKKLVLVFAMLVASFLSAVKAVSQPSSLNVSINDTVILLRKTMMDRNRYITPYMDASAGQKNSWILAGWTAGSKVDQPDTIYAEGYHQFIDFYFDTVSGRMAFTAVKDTGNNVPNLSSPTTCTVFQTINNTDPDTIQHFQFAFFDALGYAGIIDAQGKYIYQNYKGDQISFSDIDPQVVLINAFNDSGLAIIKNQSGYYLFSHRLMQRVSDIYSDTLYEIQPEIFAGTGAGRSEIFDVVNDATGTKYTCEKIRYHKRDNPVFETGIFRDSREPMHVIISNKGITGVNQFNPATDTLMLYPFEDSALIRRRLPDKEELYEYSILDLATNAETMVLGKPRHRDTLYLPLHGEHFFAKVKKELLFANEKKVVLFSTLPQGQLYSIKVQHTDSLFFFYTARSPGNNIYTYTLKMKRSGSNIPAAELIHNGFSKDKIFSMYESGILSIRNDIITGTNKYQRSFEIIDGMAAIYPGIDMKTGTQMNGLQFQLVNPAFKIKDAFINRVYFVTEFPFTKTVGASSRKKWILLELKRKGDFSFKLLELSYGFPKKSVKAPVKTSQPIKKK